MLFQYKPRYFFGAFVFLAAKTEAASRTKNLSDTSRLCALAATENSFSLQNTFNNGE
jgi:hypothetical protein